MSNKQRALAFVAMLFAYLFIHVGTASAQVEAPVEPTAPGAQQQA